MMKHLILASTVVIAFMWNVGSAAAKDSTSKDRQFTGRLEFMGEFTLFPFPASSDRGRECISGAFKLKQHRVVKKKYAGMNVTIIGEKVRYSSLIEQIGPTEHGWKGTPIPNYCGGEFVILARRVRVNNQTPK